MKGPNRQELAGVLAQLRHMYQQLVGGHVTTEDAAKSIAEGILARQIRRLELLDRVLFEGGEGSSYEPLRPLPR